MLAMLSAGVATLPSKLIAQTQPQLPSLCQAATRAGILFGSDSDSLVASEPLAYSQLLRRNCNLFAPLFQWRLTQPRSDDVAPAWEDPNIQFARQNGMRLTGGHLVWHESIPDWYTAIHSSANAEKAIVRHITTLGRAYSGAVFSWNVINEAIQPGDDREDGLRRTAFLDMFGESFFEFAFHAAREADPAALLVYNDYGMEMAGSDSERRRSALLGLLDRLLKRKIPIDAVGLQSHLRLGGDPFDQDSLKAFIKEIADRRLRILVTELDVLDDGRGRSVVARDADIAALYTAFLAPVLDEPALGAIVTWGLSDRYTWLSRLMSPSLDLPPGPTSRPLLFDADFRPKPAYYAVLSALKVAPFRPPVQRV